MEPTVQFPLLSSLRPRQWTKNLVILAALLFSEKHLLNNLMALLNVGAGMLVFCGLSGCVYLVNDIVDCQRDRRHPAKILRPIAAGILPIWKAKLAAVVIFVVCLGCAALLPPMFFFTAILFLILNFAYSFWLKNIVILDVICIALSFVLRAQAGVGALRFVEPGILMSNWLLICTFLLALFLALAKRRQEISKLQGEASLVRESLQDYSPHFIDEMTGIVCSATLIAYTIYTVSPETTHKFGTDALVYTVPPVLYGIFRYLYLIHIKELGDNPSEVVLSDRPLQMTLLAWLLIVLLALHFPALTSWFSPHLKG